MNKKLLFLSAIITSSVIAFISGQSMADYRHPDMPSGGHKCYSNGNMNRANSQNQYNQGRRNQNNPGYFWGGSSGRNSSEEDGKHQKSQNSFWGGSSEDSESQYNPAHSNYSGDKGAPYTYGQGRSSSYGYTNEGGDLSSKKLKADSAERLQGTISCLKKVQYPDGVQTEMLLNTTEGQKRVMLGPSRFVEQSKVKLQPGDKVSVLVFRVGANGDEVFVGQEVNKNGNVLKLRDDQRTAAWGPSRYMYDGNQGSKQMPLKSSNYGTKSYSKSNNGYFH